MFQTHTFQAYNLHTQANLTTTLKLNQTQPDLSLMTIQYHVGLTDKYRFDVYEKDLSYDMKFVLNSLKGFYDYLKHLHEEGNYKLCDFNKNKLTVTFLLKIFNHQQKIIKQEFQAALINDQVMWKSELKSKMEQLQVSISKSISSEITRKINDQMFQEKQMSLMKITALEKKVSRQFEHMNKKIEMVVNLINTGKNSSIQAQSSTTRHRGRYEKQKQILNKSDTFDNSSSHRRSHKGQIQKTKQIFKSQTQKRGLQHFQSNRISNRISQNLQDKHLNNHDRKIYHRKIQELEKQYQAYESKNSKNIQKNKLQSLNDSNQQKLQNYFEKSQSHPKGKDNLIKPFLLQKIQSNLNQNHQTPKKNIQNESSSTFKVSSQVKNDLKKQSLQRQEQSKQTKKDYRSTRINMKNLMVDQKDENQYKNGVQNDLRNKYFQKNIKKLQVIDLENEEEMQNFRIRITSEKDNKNANQKIKKQEGKQTSTKTNPKQLEGQILNYSKPNNFRPAKQNFNFIDRIMNSDSKEIIHQNKNGEQQSQEIDGMAKIVQTFKKNKLERKMSLNQQNPTLKNNLKISESGLKNEDNTLNELVDTQKQFDIQTISSSKVPSYDFLQNTHHFVPTVYSTDGKSKFLKYNLKDYFSFDSEGKKIQKTSVFMKSLKEYISLVGFQSFPTTGKHFMALRILKSQNYHICVGIVDMPSQIKVNQIPKNCDAIYLLDGGLHDEKGGSSRQNGWRVKDGKPVDVLKMELLMQKGELYLITVVDMDREEIEFYYNEELISATKFSSFCSRNKRRIHPYIALKSEKDCIEIV